MSEIKNYRYVRIWENLIGSTLVQETDMDCRGFFLHCIALAMKGKPPGTFKFKDAAHLARIFNTPIENVERNLQILQQTCRIKIRKIKEGFLGKIVNWHKYQGEHPGIVAGHKSKKVGIVAGPNRIGEEKKKEKEKEKETSHPLSNTQSLKDQFLQTLKDFSEELPYPFNETADGKLFDLCLSQFRAVDPIKQLELKISWWKSNPSALNSKGKSPRTQLIEYFEKEARYLRGGE